MAQVVKVHGLVVASEVPLHQGRPVVGVRPDLVIAYGSERSIPPELPTGEPLGQHDNPQGGLFSSVTRTADGVLLRCHGVCDLAMDAGATRMVVHRDPDAVPGLESVVLGGMGLATVLMLRGHLLLHASAVSVGGRAVAIVAGSGMGKSTVATLLCDAGGRMVTDDVLRVDLPPTGAVVQRGSSEARLRPSSRVAAPEGAAQRQTPDDRSAVSLPPVDVDELPLDVVVVPYPDRSATEVSVELVSRADALVVVSAFPRLVGWRDPATSGTQFQLLGELVRRVPVVVATLPWGPPFLPDLGAKVLDAVNGQLAVVPAGASGSR